MPDIIAQCKIEHNGVEYNWGDVVPQDVQDAHPNAVGPAPLTEKQITGMTKAELAQELRMAHGLGTADEEDGSDA